MASATSSYGGTRKRKHTITIGSSIVFAVGTMIGGGVFVLSGQIVDTTGPAALVSYALGGVLMLFSVLSNALIASRAPEGHSGYYYVGVALGPLWRFVVQWAFYVNGIINVAFVLQSFGVYLTQFFLQGVDPLLAGLIALLLLVLLNFGPVDRVGKAEWILVGFKLLILALFTLFGLFSIGHARFIPFAPYGIAPVFNSTAMLFIAYMGFNVISNLAGSVENPQRTVPLAMLFSVGVVAVIYIGVILALLASNVHPLGSAGVGTAAQVLMGGWGVILIAFAACLSTLSSGNANIIGCSEIMIRMTRNGDVPAVMGRTSRKGHPFVSVLLVGIVTMILMLTGQINAIISLSNVTALVAMILINLSAIKANRRATPGTSADSSTKKLMHLPAGPVIPIIGVLTCLMQLPLLGWQANVIGILLILTGFLLYLVRKRGVQSN